MKHGHQKDVVRATKRAHAAALRNGKPITWKQARRLAILWCAKMWPRAFEEHPLVEWSGSLHVLKEGAS